MPAQLDLQEKQEPRTFCIPESGQEQLTQDLNHEGFRFALKDSLGTSSPKKIFLKRLTQIGFGEDYM
jgi:hypothetical protein